MLLANALHYLLTTVFDLFTLAALLRFFMQACKAPFRNPLAQFAAALTDFAVKPLRRVIPGLFGLDLATLVVAWFAQLVLAVLLYALLFDGFPHGAAVTALIGLAFVKLLKLTLYLVIGVLIVQAVLSWVSPYHPLMPLFDTLTRPVLRPLRRFVPTVGGVDLSPLVALVICQLLLMVPVAWLEAVGNALLKAPLAG